MRSVADRYSCGMSDLCIYELEDNVWNEFSETDDHIVPHDIDGYGSLLVQEGDSRKKARHEVIGVSSNADESTIFNSQRKEETRTSIPNQKKEDRMLEKGSWCHVSDGALTASCDGGSVKELPSEDTRTSVNFLKSENIGSVGTEFSTVDPTSGNKCAMVDKDTYHFPISNISQEENGLGFLDNIRTNQSSNELLDYEWPDDLGNFDDVDRMFRSCDDSFGLGSLGNEDDFSWFSSSRTMEGSEDASMWDSKFSTSEVNVIDSVSEHAEASKVNTANDYDIKNQVASDKTDSKSAVAADCSTHSHSLCPNGSDTKSVTWQKRHVKQNHSEGKRRDRILENGGFSHGNNGTKQVKESKHSLEDPLLQTFLNPGIQQSKQNMGSNPMAYVRNHIPYMHIDYNHSLNQTSVFPCHSGIQSENNGYPSSAKESSYASNQVQSIESSHNPSFDAPLNAINKQHVKLYHTQDLQTSVSKNAKCSSIASPKALYDTVPVKKQIHKSEYETEGHCGIGISIGVPAELDSSNVQESSCMSSVLDDISLEATSFRQLQQVMEQLDIRTKLCIRDSLYRLARSAEQRHNCANSNGGQRDDGDSSDPLMAEGTNKRTGFTDMETDTNPIDRSIAHLLFHRPSDPSVTNTNDVSSIKSHAMINGSITSPSMVAEEQACQEETAIASDELVDE